MKAEQVLSRLDTESYGDPSTAIILKKPEAKLILDRVNVLELLVARLLTSVHRDQIPVDIELPIQKHSA